MKATLSNYRQSPRKVRLVANLAKGKTVARAYQALDFAGKRAAKPIKKLIASAAAASDLGREAQLGLVVRELRVDQGVTLHRSMPRARGSASRIKKRSSHITVQLS